MHSNNYGSVHMYTAMCCTVKGVCVMAKLKRTDLLVLVQHNIAQCEWTVTLDTVKVYLIFL